MHYTRINNFFEHTRIEMGDSAEKSQYQKETYEGFIPVQGATM